MSNIKELIRAEVKRLFKKYQESERLASKDCDNYNGEDIAFYQGKRKVCSEILSFLDALPDEPVTDCHELKEAAEKSWVDYEYREDPRGLYSSCYIDGFIAGAELQKRKMMGGAVEGVVNHGTAVSYVISDEDQLDKRLKQFQNDAEVRIIILPKEEEG